MNKPEIETTKALFKEFPTKHIDSVPSIKSWELNEIKIIQTNRKDNPKLSSQNSEEIIELNHMSPNSKLRKSENPSTASLEGKISHKKTKGNGIFLGIFLKICVRIHSVCYTTELGSG